MVRNVLRLPNSLATTEEGNPSGPIRTGHNQHTHTGKTRQLELNSRVPLFICHPKCMAYTIITNHKQIGACAGNHCYGSYTATLGGVPNTNMVRNVPRLPNSLATTKEGNPSGPIRTGHNQHTHTGKTRQLELNSRVPLFICHPKCMAYTIITNHKQIGARAGNHCYGSYTATLGGVPNTNMVRNVPRLPNSLATTEEPVYKRQIWTHPYWPQPAHSHQKNSPTRAQLKGSSVHLPSQAQLDRCHSELNLRDATCLTSIPSLTQGICSEFN
ncbi:hypothetical protein DEO72_LG3g1860 [Vigna unguiculata]|uniref:Uncharacterized protein n=1 Tax=Vigna unguiculata TaxID=3917 RepID=A0A4D6LFZ5_VIGUN|nr:hypothetical protein DEO72_LG3g1860 [Vigna unguiculata]